MASEIAEECRGMDVTLSDVHLLIDLLAPGEGRQPLRIPGHCQCHGCYQLLFDD
jgi:hypothetical protein